MEEVETAVELLESLPSVWAEADVRRDAEALYDLIGSIVPEKVTSERGIHSNPVRELDKRLPGAKNAERRPTR